MWQPLATIAVSDTWQYTPATTATYIRLRTVGDIALGRGYLAQAFERNPTEIELFDPVKIHPLPEMQILKLDKLFWQDYGQAMIAVRRSMNLDFNWTLEIDHLPTSQPDIFLAKETVTSVANSTVNVSITPVLIAPAFSSRKDLQIKNTSSRILYLKFGQFLKLSNGQYPAQSVLIAESHFSIAANATWDAGFKYQGAIEGFWSGTGGTATVNQFF